MSINYELSKDLMGAGFPHLHDDPCYFSMHESGVCVAITLEELIDACKEEFVALFRLVHAHQTMRWEAKGKITKSKLTVGQGATPEEAVARLWLALNPTPTHKRII